MTTHTEVYSDLVLEALDTGSILNCSDFHHLGVLNIIDIHSHVSSLLCCLYRRRRGQSPTQQVDHHGVPEQQREAGEHEGEERRPEEEEAEEVDGDQRVPSAPHVHQHDDEGLTQEEDVGEQAQQLQRPPG